MTPSDGARSSARTTSIVQHSYKKPEVPEHIQELLEARSKYEKEAMYSEIVEVEEALKAAKEKEEAVQMMVKRIS